MKMMVVRLLTASTPNYKFEADYHKSSLDGEFVEFYRRNEFVYAFSKRNIAAFGYVLAKDPAETPEEVGATV